MPAPQQKNRAAPPPPGSTARPAASPRQAAPVPLIPPGPIGQIPRPGEATAFDANQRALADKVSAYLSNVQQLIGNFVQVGPDGSRVTGDFYIQKPGKVKFEYDAPSPIDIVADGQSVAVRDRKLATQDLYQLSQTPLRFLLSNNLDLMRDTNLIGVYADDTFATVVIEEKQALVGTHRLMLMFGAKDLQLKQWTVTDPQGYDTTVAIYNLDSSKKPDPNLFKIDYTRFER
jgi:outer membrane lipoprotein-sorting protein